MKIRYKYIFDIFVAFAFIFTILGNTENVRPVYAASFIVTKAADTADGTCDTDCSLREEINAANSDASADTITFAANYIITLVAQLPTVKSNITINGNGIVNTIIEASTCDPVSPPNDCTKANYGVFAVDRGGNLTLDSLTVRNGYYTGIYGGGAIFNYGGISTVMNSLLLSNQSSEGGGIYNFFGTITVINSTLSNNRSDFGIWCRPGRGKGSSEK